MENLSEREKAEVAKILKEISQGKSDTYKSLLYEDYDEIPVDIHTFLRDRKYLGNALYNTEGKFTVFPYWEETMEKIFPDPLKPAKYNTLALTGAIGLGKSFMAVLCMLYELYRMMCLKNPYTYYGLQPIDKITFAVMNITLEASRGVAWDKLQQLLQSSEWFMERGTISGTSDIVWNPPKGIELITGSLPRHILGRAVFCAFIDEVSFQPNADIKAQIEKAKEIVNAASIRMQSRFMKGNKNPTLLIIASSKRTEQSYMETFIARKKKLESKTTYVVDEPQWIIRTDKDSKEKFYVAVGNKFLESTIVPLSATEEDLRIYRDRGYSLLKVPIGYYEQFEEDIEKSLQDIAGYSTTSSSRYISGVRLKETKHSDYQNAFTQDIIETGNGVGDDVQYYDYFDLNRIPYGMKEKPLYVHLDMSISGDKTGLAGVWIKGTTPHKEGQPDSKDGVYQVAFSVSIKAPKGTQISFAKNRQFIKWLREQGFNIKLVSFDTFQSYDTGQELQNAGFNTEITSVDKCTDHICLPYQFFKSVIYEKRLILYDKCDLLTEEIIGLERDNNTGRIDHSPTGINCFTGDTKIRLVDGRSLSILNLKKEFEDGKVNFVYSFNHETQRIEPRPISNVFKSGHNATLVEVTLDNGEKIHCTPEHKFMLRDGTYCEAKNLYENQSLMPLYTKLSSKGLKGYRLFYEPMTEDWHYEHRAFCNEVLDEKYLVHHKDCNKLNNNPSNLIYCSRSAHQQIHAKIQSGAQSPQANNKRKESVKKYHEVNKQNPEYWTRYVPYKNMTPQQAYESHIEHEVLEEERKQVHLQRHLAHQKKLKDQLQKQQEMAEYYGVDLDKLQGTELQALMIKYAHDIDPQYQETVSKAVSENHKKGKYKNAYIALQKCNEERRGKPRPKEVVEKMKKTLSEHGPYEISEETRKKRSEATKRKRWYHNGETSIYIDKDAPVPEGYVPGRIKTWKNHKVVSVKYLSYVEDVYDITVDGTHNFALDAGVFVHNSKDACDSVCAAVWNASKHIEEFNFDFGETLDAIVDVSSSSSQQQTQQQVLLDFESELLRARQAVPDKKQEEDYFLDFGFGKRGENFDNYMMDGIII